MLSQIMRFLPATSTCISARSRRLSTNSTSLGLAASPSYHHLHLQAQAPPEEPSMRNRGLVRSTLPAINYPSPTSNGPKPCAYLTSAALLAVV